FGDQIARASADDVHAQHAVGRLVSENFDASIGLTKRSRPPVGAEEADAFAIGYSCFLQLVFGFADRGDLGMRVNDRRNHVVVHVTADTSQPLDANHPFFHRFVGEHQAADAVASSINIRHAGLEILVHSDKTATVGFQ